MLRYLEEKDEYFMKKAIDQALTAQENGDVPIGCIITFNDRVIAKGYNQREQLIDPTAHAEMIALTQASDAQKSWRLHGCTLYVTLEPCPMCAGALVLSRIDRVVFGCCDPKTGAAGSIYNILQDDRLNHQVQITKGVLEKDCSFLLKNFFANRRLEKNSRTET